MRQILWNVTFFFAVASLHLNVQDALAGDAVCVRDILGLSQEHRKALMRSLLERRIDRVRNIQVSSVTRLYNREYSDGRLGKHVGDSGWFEFDTRHCDGSHRVKSSWFVSQTATIADSISESHYDEKSGIVRIVSGQPDSKGHEGRIGHEHLPSITCNSVALHLLSGFFVIDNALDKSDFLLPSLMECADKWQVDVNVQEQHVVISHPYRMHFFNSGSGTRKVYFDAAKGMLPVRIETDFQADLASSKEPHSSALFWEESRIMMDDVRDFDGFWMPMRIEERGRSSLLPPNICSIKLTNVNRIVFGKVKKEDLEIMFPPDTEVADAIKNVFYRTGPDGDPTEPINPIGIPEGGIITLDARGRLVTNQNWTLRVGLVSTGIGMALFLCLFLWKRRLRTKKIST